MSDKNKKAAKTENEDIETNAPEKEAVDDDSVLKAKLLEAESTAKKALTDAAEANDKYLRLAAEYDNYRKRTQKERDALYTDAFADAVTALLPIVDNLDRAVAFATDDSELSKGILMLKKQTEEVLLKLKVEEIPSDGAQFDPALHNAIMHEEDENSPENTVSATLQKGYRIGDKVIRYALVKVVN